MTSGARRAASPARGARRRIQGDAMTTIKRTHSRLGVLALAAGMAACSGGSDLPSGGISGGEGTGTGSGGSFGGTTAEGVYGGGLSGGSFGSFVMAVLENGAFWMFYGRGSPAALDMAG